jgi:hypothetical protein
MSHASDNYDAKLREKMEEWTALQADRPNDDRRDLLNVSIPKQTQALPTKPMSKEEVQTLIAQWKTITDMTSNLSKDINDMAMTNVRNLR